MISPSEPSHVPTLLHLTAHDGHMRDSPRCTFGGRPASQLRYQIAIACQLEAAPLRIGRSGWVMTARARPGSLLVRTAKPLPFSRSVPRTIRPWAATTPWRFVVSEAAWLRGVSPRQAAAGHATRTPVVDRGSAPGRLGLSGRRGCDAGRLRAVARPGPGSTSRWGANGPFGISRSWTLGCSAAAKACTPESPGSCTQGGTWNGRGSNWRPARPHYPTCPCATQTANVPRSPFAVGVPSRF